jgi:signal transduction histidine kinase
LRERIVKVMRSALPKQLSAAGAAIALVGLLSVSSGRAGGDPPAAPLTTVAAIRHLSPQEAEQGLPVKLQGVISYNAPGFNLMFLQDETGGIYVHPRGLDATLGQLPAGTLVSIEGITVPGQFAPRVEGPNKTPVTVTRLGERALPDPLQLTIDQLADPQYHGLWIEVGGVVRSLRTFRDANAKWKAVLTVGPSNARFTAVINGKAAHDPTLGELVGAQVRMRGVYGSDFNERRQLLGVRLFVTSRNEITVERKSSGSPFSLHDRPISSLMQFSSDSDSATRACVRGTVTARGGRNGFYMQDDTAGLWVTGEGLPGVHAGNIVNVVGFPALRAWSPVLEDAEVHIEGRGPLPHAKVLSAADALRGEHCFERVVVEAELLQAAQDEFQPAFVMQSGGQVFLAKLAGEAAGQSLPRVAEGSLLRLTGVCFNDVDRQIDPRPFRDQPNEFARTATFRLLLDSPEDIVVAQPPPWWTIQRLAGVVAMLLAVLCAAGLWVALLRRKIAAQTAIIRERLAREAVHDERTRIARELHDTLEQEITGIAMHIDVATALLDQSPDTARQSLDTARLLLDRSRTESRRSIWELRSTALEQGGLAAAFAEQTNESRREGGPDIELSVDGPPRRLPAKTEIHLFRIGHEALTNAIKHSDAQHVSLRLRFDDEEVSVAVEDDGEGFDLPINGAAQNGHFGLLGMRERAAKIQARLEIDSAHGRGTRVSAAVHIPAAQRAVP